ncbi:glutamyl aminopeptidase [Camelus ferus]|nr:glutamyl aminopeptidase [Camelus ferus]
MNFEEGESSKRYCIKTKHVAIICAVVVAVGLIVGLSVGLTRSCDSTDGGQGTTQPPSHLPSTPSPPQDQEEVCPASEDESGGWKDFRLPDFINPVHYDLEMKPLLEEDKYTGSVHISINVSSPTQHLWLHIRETRITQLPVLRRHSGEQVQVRRCFEYKKQEYVVVEAEGELAPSSAEGLYHLTMEFAGSLNGSLVGFYRTTYVEKGQVKSIAATDHEPTDARKSFPCFDEPNKKATYTVSIIHLKEYKALSNMPVEKEESVDDKWNRTTFQKSVPMSTYLVCFAVHQFDSVTRMSKRGIPLTIYVQPEQKHTAEYAANITKSVFDYFEDYFAMEYSLPKLDKIAIPDFGTGAMENWGLITYRETNLLYDPEESASSNQQRVATVVAHELVHQWFGNIVTMEWWDDLWLNEGFASFFEFLGVEHAEKEWQMVSPKHISSKSVFLMPSRLKPLDYDNGPEGASILRMLEDWITPEKFQKGCQGIQTLHALLLQPGGHWGKMRRSEMLVYTVTPNQQSSKRMKPVGIALNSPNPSGNAFLKINPDHIGFYRVNYEVPTWERIAINLSNNHQEFSSADRAGLIDDAFALARAQLLNYKEALNLTKYLKMEEDFLPWERVISAVTYIISMFEDDREIYPMIEGKILQRLLRASVLGLACKMGDSDALNNASQLFQKWLTGTVSLPVNLRLLVYRYGMQNSGNETSWNYTLEQYEKTSLAQEKEKLLYGLASVKNVTLLSRYLDLLKDSNLIKTQDVFTVIRYISYNSYGKTMAWNWIQLNWEYLVNRYTINDRNLGRIVTIAEPFNTELQLWQIKSFFERYPEAGAGEKPREQVLETVKNNIEWLKQNRDTIRDWFFDLS